MQPDSALDSLPFSQAGTMDGASSSEGTGGAGIKPVGDLPGRQPLPGLPEDLAAATSLPMEDPLPSPPGTGPMQVPLPQPSPGHLRCGLFCSLKLSSHVLCASTHHLRKQTFGLAVPRDWGFKDPSHEASLRCHRNRQSLRSGRRCGGSSGSAECRAALSAVSWASPSWAPAWCTAPCRTQSRSTLGALSLQKQILRSPQTGVPHRQERTYADAYALSLV